MGDTWAQRVLSGELDRLVGRSDDAVRRGPVELPELLGKLGRVVLEALRREFKLGQP